MSEWQSVNLSSLVPDEVRQTTDAVGSVTDIIGQGLSSVSSALNAVSNLIIDVNDPIRTVIDNTTVKIEELVNTAFNVLNTGIYFYYDGGPLITGGNPDGVPGFTTRLDASLRDPGDENRPQFNFSTNTSSNTKAVVLCAGAENIPTLLPTLKLMGDLFSIQKFNYAYDRLKNSSKSLPEEILLSMPSPPDWYSMKMGDCLSFLSDIDEKIIQTLGMIRTASAAGDFLSELVHILDEKAKFLLDMANEIQMLADRLTSFVNTPGVIGLHIQTENGAEGIIDSIRFAGNSPSWNYDTWVIGVVLLGITSDFEAIPGLFGL